MELRSGRMLSHVVRTVFLDEGERKNYICEVIKDLLDQNTNARGIEKKLFYVGQVYKIVLVHKDFIWPNPAFKIFKKEILKKAKELKIYIAEKITQGQLSADNLIYKETIFYLKAF